MDPSEFPGSLGPLSLPDKPLIGDLPADMEFGEDLLASQTATVPQASILPPQEMEWEAPKEAAQDGDLDLGLVKAASPEELSKPSSEDLAKSDPLDLLEKPSILENLNKEPEDQGALEKAEDLDSLYKPEVSVDPEEGSGGPSEPGTEALVPEAWKEEEGAPKVDSESTKDAGTEEAASLPDIYPVDSPDVVEVGSIPPTEEQAASPGGSPTSQRQVKRARLKAPRKSSPLRKEEATVATSTEKEPELVPNSTSEASVELVEESPPQAESQSSGASQEDPAKQKAPEPEQPPQPPGGSERVQLTSQVPPSPPPPHR